MSLESDQTGARLVAGVRTRRTPVARSLLEEAARLCGLGDTQKISSQKLYKKLQSSRDMERAMRLARRRRRKRDTISSEQVHGSAERKRRKKCRKREDEVPLDPIMLCPLPQDKSRHFAFYRPNGLRVVYDCATLADYMLASGTFLEPETRLKFSDDDLKRLDEINRTCMTGRASTYEASKDKKRWDKQSFLREAIVGLDRCMGRAFTQIMRLIERGENTMSVQLRLLTDLLPTCADFYAQIAEIDVEAAKTCVRMHLEFLRGPPNKPTEDPAGIINNVANYMEQTMNSPVPNTTSPVTIVARVFSEVPLHVGLPPLASSPSSMPGSSVLSVGTSLAAFHRPRQAGYSQGGSLRIISFTRG